ncbi:MAG: hypothetical protein DPW09_28375 [Anaerolineae bacterium]|nr:hypothetical protein [Anaerolineales bacterium]MCQ3977363.1 hypothetical protein [Anaerolineae bacterium]
MPILAWLRANWLPVALIGGLVAAFLLLKHSPTEGIDSLPALEKAVSAGQPTVIEFYSNF